MDHAPDFIAHQRLGLAILSPGQKAHLRLYYKAATVRLPDPVTRRYLADMRKDEE